jgi:hypothetical protein
MSFDLDSYVDVAERIARFYDKHPDGRLSRLGEPKLMEVGGKLFIVYTARAYRTPDDPIPAIGTAWEPFPGPTQFTRDSELMNAETAAWGRAIVAAGIPAKKIASREEVAARTSAPAPPPAPIGEKGAVLLWDAAEAAGIEIGKLQLAAAHVTKGKVGEFANRDEALAALGALSVDQGIAVDNWIKKKAAE